MRLEPVRDELHRAGATPRAKTVTERSIFLLKEHINATMGTVRGGRPDPLQRPFGRCEIQLLEHAKGGTSQFCD